MHAIEVVDLIKKYNKADKNAVDGVTFSVEEGEFFALLGPNGAGKTTTISILTTTLSKTSGHVSVVGYDIDKQASEVRRRVGIIFQNPSLDLNLTGEENVRLHAMLYGIYPFRPTYKSMPPDYQKLVLDLAEILGLSNDLFKPIKTFSGGMKRKLEIIRSLTHKPRVLFLDEPTVGLDPLSRNDLWEYMQMIRKRDGMTVFLTTHYLDEAEGADRVCIINSGKVVSLGTPDSIKKGLTAEYLYLDSEDRLKLRVDLEKLGVSFTDDEPFKVLLEKVSAQHIIQGVSVPLTVLKTHSPTLEEAYLAIVEEKK